MNYCTDKPINTAEQDLLGRASFSNQLGRAIYEYKNKDGLVIGLFGKWGTGKTSVINMAINELNNLSKDDENKPIIMKFAPWNYSDKNSLISLFFKNLSYKLNNKDNDAFQKKVGKALTDYAGALDLLSLVPVIGTSAAAVTKSFVQAKGTRMMKGVDLDKSKEILEKALVEANKKIIIIIDDIDRLTNSQIRDIFQLVKQVADFSNVVYILSMDREIVCNALSEVHNINGNEYLEKIIQVPFELPELQKSKLHSVFCTKLEQIIGSLSDEISWDKDYWSEVFENCVAPYISTLRDVNRFANTFQFKYALLCQETSFEDMVGITVLEVLEPKLYKWIYHNKDTVCGVIHALSAYSGSKPDYRKLYHTEFENLGINADLAIKCVSTMFPTFAKDVNYYHYGYQQASCIRGAMRIANDEKFDLYFLFNLDEIKISRSMINACLYQFDRNELSASIEKFNTQGNIIYYLEEVDSLIDKIPQERLKLHASVLLELQNGFTGDRNKSIFTVSACTLSEDISYKMLGQLESEEERYEVLSTIIKNAGKYCLGTMGCIISRIELSYGRLSGDSRRPDDQVISLAHLQNLEIMYKEKLQNITDSETILDIHDFQYAFYLWGCLDKSGVDKYIQAIFTCVENKLKFLCALAGKWNGTNGSGWSFSKKNYASYISPEEVLKLIQGFDKSKLDIFTEDEQIKLASFVLNYGKPDMEYVNEQKALIQVNLWKKGADEIIA